MPLWKHHVAPRRGRGTQGLCAPRGTPKHHDGHTFWHRPKDVEGGGARATQPWWVGTGARRVQEQSAKRTRVCRDPHLGVTGYPCPGWRPVSRGSRDPRLGVHTQVVLRQCWAWQEGRAVAVLMEPAQGQQTRGRTFLGRQSLHINHPGSLLH